MKKDKKTATNKGSTSFKESWTIDNAMFVLQHPTVDAKIWAEAVEWLLLHGPAEVRELLLSSSLYATSEQFPTLKPTGCTKDGELCYEITEIAEALGIDPDEAEEMLREKEKCHGIRHGIDPMDINKVQ